MTQGEPLKLDLDALGAALKEGREELFLDSADGGESAVFCALDAGDALLAEVRRLTMLLEHGHYDWKARAETAEAEVRRLRDIIELGRFSEGDSRPVPSTHTTASPAPAPTNASGPHTIGYVGLPAPARAPQEDSTHRIDAIAAALREANGNSGRLVGGLLIRGYIIVHEADDRHPTPAPSPEAPLRANQGIPERCPHCDKAMPHTHALNPMTPAPEALTDEECDELHKVASFEAAGNRQRAREALAQAGNLPVDGDVRNPRAYYIRALASALASSRAPEALTDGWIEPRYAGEMADEAKVLEALVTEAVYKHEADGVRVGDRVVDVNTLATIFMAAQKELRRASSRMPEGKP